MSQREVAAILRRIDAAISAETNDLCSGWENGDDTVHEPLRRIGLWLLELGSSMISDGGLQTRSLDTVVCDTRRRVSAMDHGRTSDLAENYAVISRDQ